MIPMDFNEKTALIHRLLDYAEADPPMLFSLTEDASAADLDEAARIISSLRENVGEGLAPPASLPI